MKNFALIGASGYIAPRHMKAIKQTNNNLISAYDKFDSVGVLDNYFPEANFFTEFERFERHISKLKYRESSKIDYISICSPNYLHDSHIRFALNHNADAICEKPLVLNPWNINALQKIEKETGRKIHNILQLRMHNSIIELKRKIDDGPKNKIYDIDLTYITTRGKWYYSSWKGDISKSGGIATNIGIHFFDMLTWIFGDVKQNVVHLNSHDRSSGYLEFNKARVRWFLSINRNVLPEKIKVGGNSIYRNISIGEEKLDFSDGFLDLHTLSYKKILNGNGFGIEETRNAIEIVHHIRNEKPIGLKGDFHPFAKKPLTKHPFTN